MFRFLLAVFLIVSTPAWAVTQWNKSMPASGDNQTAWPAAVVSQWSIVDTLLSNYRRGETVIYKNATTLTVTLGEVVVTNSGGSLRIFLQDAGNTDITTANLDSGASFSAGTTYYVYAAASSSTAASSTYYISLSSTAPTGPTYYTKLGFFTTDGSGNIVPYQVYKANYAASTTDGSGNSLVPLSISDYGSSASSSTARYGNQLRIAYGVVSVSAGSSTAISALPFVSSSSYMIFASETGGSGTDESRGSIGATASSGSAASVYNTDNASHSASWFAIGY